MFLALFFIRIIERKSTSHIRSDTNTYYISNICLTGANSGVGLAGAKLLIASGHHVILACRTQAKADAAAAKCMAYATTSGDSFYMSRRAGGSAIGAECDLSSLSSVRTFAKSMEDRNIDTIVLNAGLAHGQADKEPFRTVEGFEETVGVNHLGHFLLADLMARTLAKSNSKPRLVSTASPVHDPVRIYILKYWFEHHITVFLNVTNYVHSSFDAYFFCLISDA